MKISVFRIGCAFTLAIGFPYMAAALPPPPPPSAAMQAAKDDRAWQIVSDLTTEIGPRQAGTVAEQRARDWAVKRLSQMGFANVRAENFDMPTWVRGEEAAEVISPYPQPLVITALGNSASTGEKPLVGEIAYFPSYAALKNARPHQIKGKIAFVDHRMRPAQDGSSYGHYGKARFIGPNLAAKKGAIAYLVRSMGTDSHRMPHTGNTVFEANVAPIPAAAISSPDADNLVRMMNKVRFIPLPGSQTAISYRATPLKISLKLTPKNLGMQRSGNVIAEVKGSKPDLPPLLLACHLDSWDLGTGAIDDGAGCAIITAAASYFIKGRQPKRTIRLLWAGAEEVGVWGGKAYAEKYGNMPHALAMESDFGADRVWRVDFTLPMSAAAVQRKIADQLSALGVSTGYGTARGGADIRPIIKTQNLPIIDLRQDGRRYFDIHHSADDNLDKIDKEQLRQNVRAWAIVIENIANYEGDLNMGIGK